MFHDPNALDRELTPAERAAFEQLVRAIGYAREVKFGHGSEARLLRDFPASVVYALTPIERFLPHVSHPHQVHEFRLLVAVADATAAPNGGPPKKRGRPPKRDVAAAIAAPKVKPLRRDSPEYKAKMSAIGRANWRKRVKKYGPTGVTPGKEPWKRPNNIAYQKHQAKLARLAAAEAKPPQAPSHPIKTF